MDFKSIILVSLLLLLTVQFNTQGQTSSTTEDPLVTLLINKGLLTKEDAQTILAAGDVTQQRDRLAVLLKDKGLISATEFEALRGPAKTVAAGEPIAVNAAPPKSSTQNAPPRVIRAHGIHFEIASLPGRAGSKLRGSTAARSSDAIRSLHHGQLDAGRIGYRAL